MVSNAIKYHSVDFIKFSLLSFLVRERDNVPSIERSEYICINTIRDICISRLFFVIFSWYPFLVQLVRTCITSARNSSDSASFATECQRLLSLRMRRDGVSSQSKSSKRESNRKWTERKYHVQIKDDVRHFGVKMGCSSEMFPELPFADPTKNIMEQEV